MREILDGLPGHIDPFNGAWPDGGKIGPYEGAWPHDGKIAFA